MKGFILLLASCMFFGEAFSQTDCNGTDENPPEFGLISNIILGECEEIIDPGFDFFDESPVTVSSVSEDVEVGSTCILSTPDLGTNACMYPYPWSFSLFALPLPHRFYEVVSAEFNTFGNDEGVILAEVRNVVNPNGYFHVEIYVQDRLDWEAWSALGRQYHADCNSTPENHPFWDYYTMGPGSFAQGYGDYEGSYLNLYHAPMNLNFGLQVGDGANNMSPGPGIGAWFTYNGNLIDASQNYSQNISGAGDIAFMMECCFTDLQRINYIATDACGNVSEADRLIGVLDTSAPSLASEIPDWEGPVDLCEFLSAGMNWTDHCAADPVVTIETATDENNPDWLSATFTATDQCGNSNTVVLTGEVIYGPCIYVGCNDEAAANYSPDVIINDGTCFYTCPEDYDMNHVVGVGDLIIFIYAFQQNPDEADLDEDGEATVEDLMMMIGSFGATCD